MAKGNDQGGPAGVVDPEDRHREESPVSDLAPGADDRDESMHEDEQPIGYAPAKRVAREGAGLKIYKPNQGYYTRVGTAIGAVILTLAGAGFIFTQLGDWLPHEKSYFFPVQYGMTVAFLLIMTAVIYWVTGLNRRAVDFFVATEGEMKKVNWSTRQEVVRSTKVVIVTVLLMATMLFVVDIAFMLFFSSIGVLKGSPGLRGLFGGGTPQ
jgi:preprotein translocase SecE subunit